jgi:3',5'-cyclic-AMP phosphodiesterase
MSNHIHENFNDDGVDRRGFLKCMAWAGTGLVFTMTGGIASSRMLLAAATDQGGSAAGDDFTCADQ